jgi:hypothetical protein
MSFLMNDNYKILSNIGTTIDWTDWTNQTITSSNTSTAGLAADKITLNGRDLEGRLQKIEERLNIIHRNYELETRWSNLKQLGEQYQKLEQELVATEKVIAILEK